MHDSAKGLQAVPWGPVPDAELAQSRYKRIFRVRAYDNGQHVSTGLGWAVNGTRVATAAHVLFGDQFKADKCELDWLAAGTTSTSVVWKAAEDYISPGGVRRKGSRFDIARIHIDLSPPPPSKPLPPHGMLELIRWRDGQVQRAFSAVNEVLPFLGHSAVTEPGDSGGPVFMGDRIVGMVLGNAALSRPYLPKNDRARLKEPSSALAITPKALEFLLT